MMVHQNKTNQHTFFLGYEHFQNPQQTHPMGPKHTAIRLLPSEINWLKGHRKKLQGTHISYWILRKMI